MHLLRKYFQTIIMDQVEYRLEQIAVRMVL